MSSKIVLQALIIIVISVLVSSFEIKTTTGQAVRQVDASIDVRSASCEWKQDHFEVCSYVTWEGEGVSDKAKIVITNSGVSLGKAPVHVQSPVTYCLDAGTELGRRAVVAYLLDRKNAYVDIDSDTIIYCKKDNREFRTETKSASFRAKSINNRGRSQGTYELRGFPGRPSACTLEGIYRVDDRLKKGQRTGPCHRASGVFSGFASEGQQYVISDADEFSWWGLKARQDVDPPSKRIDSYVAYMETCDPSFFGQGRYYVRASVIEFTDEGLILEWEYFNEDSKPAVDFIFEVSCDIGVERQPSIFPEVEEEVREEAAQQAIEIEEPVEEAAVAQEEVAQPRVSIWQRIKNFFTMIFS